jgi:thioredoxin 1
MKILYFHADWCQPCKAMEPIVKELLKKYPKVELEKVDVDKHQAFTEKWEVMSIPTFIFIDGKEVAREVGSVSKEKLEKHLTEKMLPHKDLIDIIGNR